MYWVLLVLVHCRSNSMHVLRQFLRSSSAEASPTWSCFGFWGQFLHFANENFDYFFFRKFTYYRLNRRRCDVSEISAEANELTSGHFLELDCTKSFPQSVEDVTISEWHDYARQVECEYAAWEHINWRIDSTVMLVNEIVIRAFTRHVHSDTWNRRGVGHHCLSFVDGLPRGNAIEMLNTHEIAMAQ